jgi:hypothetical protein
MKKTLILFIVLQLGCSPVSPRASFEERRIQRAQEFENELKNSPVIVAVVKLQENLKRDYREIIGPSQAFDEKMEQQFRNALNEAMLESPGQYKRVAKMWAETRADPVPTREEIQEMVKRGKERIKKLDAVIAQEVQMAEEQAKQDAEQRKKIIQVIAGIAVVALAVGGAAAAASAAYQPTYNSTAMGPYTIIRTGPYTTTVLTPSGGIYTCTTTGTYQLSVVNCF